jgi:hypothetical protein
MTTEQTRIVLQDRLKLKQELFNFENDQIKNHAEHLSIYQLREYRRARAMHRKAIKEIKKILETLPE